jgi:hypothetical protein
MPKISKEKEEKFVRQMRQYTDADLSKFHGLVQKYYEDYTCDNGDKIRVLNRVKLGVAFGALSPEGAVLYDPVEDRVVRYPEFENILEQWGNWKLRMGFDPRSHNYQKVQQLEAMAEQQMNIQS